MIDVSYPGLDRVGISENLLLEGKVILVENNMERLAALFTFVYHLKK